MNNIRKLKVTTNNGGARLDIWLRKQLTSLSRSQIQALIRTGQVTINGKRVKEHRKTRFGDEIQVIIPQQKHRILLPEPIPLDIIYQDDYLIAVNKSPGIVVHPAAGNISGTLLNALLYSFPDIAGTGNEQRPGIVHRLDKYTSGVLMVARNEKSYSCLINQFKNHQIIKVYLALVHGTLKPLTGTIKTLIGRAKYDRKKMSAKPSTGRMAITNYQTLKVFNDISLVRVQPETGRTHQIRVHFAHAGHAVIGDTQYGKLNDKTGAIPITRQMLHAFTLKLMHPATEQQIQFKAPIPHDMAKVIEQLSGKNIAELITELQSDNQL